MKRVFRIAMIAVSVLAIFAGQGMAASKSDTKSAKQQAKALVKEGWKPEGITTIENAMIKLSALEADGATTLVGSSYGSQKPNVAKTKARNDAMNQFAEDGKAIIRARINTDVSDINEVETDNIISGYERIVMRELNQSLGTPKLTLIRDNNGRFDSRVFYSINSNALANLQKKALEEALDNSDTASKYGDKISNFVNSAFNDK